jgi:hypothetical protein
MNELTLRLATQWVVARGAINDRVESRRFDERGEGVISTAIAVLIVALIGVGALVAFRALVSDAGTNARNQVNNYSAG